MKCECLNGFVFRFSNVCTVVLDFSTRALKVYVGYTGVQESAVWRTMHNVLQGGDDETCKAALAGTLVRWLVAIWGHKPSLPKEVKMDEG